MKNIKKIIISALALGLLTLCLFTLNHNSSQLSSYFSAYSLTELQKLSQKHQVYIEELFEQPDQALQSELYQANLFVKTPLANYQGLVASLATDRTGETSILKIQTNRQLSLSDLQAIAQDYQQNISEFSNVEVDQKINLSSAEKLSVNPVRRITAKNKNRQSPDARHQATSEKLLKIALIDSGVDLNHEIFQDKHLEKGWNTLSNDNNMYDDIGHGTHLAGIIASNAPQADIIPYKVINQDDGRLSNVIAALKRAMDDDVDVINMSFGINENSEILSKVITDLQAKNIIVVAAAGNNDSSLEFYPAAYPSVIAVTAVDQDDNKLKSSAHGAWVDVATNGNQIFSSLPDNTYGRKNGTSQATAIVSAYLLNHSNLWPKKINAETIKNIFTSAENKIGTDLLKGVPILDIPIVTEF